MGEGSIGEGSTRKDSMGRVQRGEGSMGEGSMKERRFKRPPSSPSRTFPLPYTPSLLVPLCPHLLTQLDGLWSAVSRARPSNAFRYILRLNKYITFHGIKHTNQYSPKKTVSQKDTQL